MSSCKKCRKILRHNALLISTIIGIVLGLCVGLGVRQLNPTQDVLMWLGLPGQLYLRSLKMVIVPLVITGVITGTSSLDPRANGKISIVAICFIFLKNLLGAILGIIAFMVFKPGAGSTFSELSGTSAPSSDIQTQDVFADLLRNVVPDNFFEATFRQSQTKYKRIATSSNSSQFDNNTIHWIIDKSVGKTDGPNLLGLIFVCSLIGMALSSQKARSKLVIDVCDILGQTVITIIGWILWVTPFGVFSLMVVTIAEIQDITSSFTDLGMLIVSVSLFLIIQQIIVMPLVLFLLTKRNPFKHLLHIARPWCISFASATSSGAIPEMFRCCEANLEVNKIISRFVIPFSVTVGASGSAVYIACSSLFACSISGYTPTVATILMVGLLTTISAFAIPSVPSASIVTTVMILTSLNISTDVIVLLLTVEFILDRLRTASCVVGHTMCAVVVQHFCTKEVSQLNDQNDDDEVEININNEKEPGQDTLLMLETQVTNRNPC